MKNKKHIFIFLLLILCLLGGLYVVKAQLTTAKENVVSAKNELRKNKSISQKVGVFVWPYKNYQKEERNHTYIDAQLKIAKKDGFRYVVIPVVFYRSLVHGKKYDDQVFKYAITRARNLGLHPIVPFSTSNSRENRVYQTDHKQIVNKYKSLVSQVIRTYAGQGIIWEGWNEPNSLFWFDQSQDGLDDHLVKAWVELDNYIGKTIKAYDAHSIYLTGNFSGFSQDNQKVLSRATLYGLLKYGDAIANHPYQFQTTNNGNPENLFTNDQQAFVNDSVQAAKRKSLPLVTTEIGYSTTPSFQGKWSQDEQAAFEARSVLVLDMMRQPIIVLYSLVDDGNAGDWGLYSGSSPNFKEKKSAVIVRKMLKELDGYHFVKQHVLHDKDDFIVVYKKKNRLKYVYWTSGTSKTVLFKGKNLVLTKTPSYLNQ
ncbi:cellulase family glycosylhydrolase [Pediococcus cellicola]|uniref:Glycoside hydrolase family 5 domain-containing protein n=1 Tax=Pediococcus cellicola TaxID=319652 RepID=A0A0R2IM68_9LACO|nr:cellulase family glycosylhydrolase [Pediococcus cellicola]KRN66081.1 hypothetical protein IV80_GL001642 [Pediococcus cellicola]GEL15447.1 glycosyl hydrolase [Pediococcus cellicola]